MLTVMASEVGYTCTSSATMNSISDASTIMFAIPPTDDFIGFQESYMVVKVKVLKANGAELTNDNVLAALSDNVLGSLFK